MVLSGPALIGSCDDLILDPTGSSGLVGRPWAVIFWTVTSNEAVEVSALQNYLNTKFTDTNDLATIPRSMLDRGVQYFFLLTLGNWCGKFDAATISVKVQDNSMLPTLTISGKYLSRFT